MGTVNVAVMAVSNGDGHKDKLGDAHGLCSGARSRYGVWCVRSNYSVHRYGAGTVHRNSRCWLAKHKYRTQAHAIGWVWVERALAVVMVQAGVVEVH